MCTTRRIPRPPPPKAALNITGSPYASQNCFASSNDSTGPAVPGTTVTPVTEINTLLLIYITICLQCFDAVGWAAGRASGL